MKPDLLIMGARFYPCSAPYMIGLLKIKFPNLKIAVVSLDDYPADLGMEFILNGVTYYANMMSDAEHFSQKLTNILQGKIENGNVIYPKTVEESFDSREGLDLAPIRELPKKKMEVIRCICNGFQKNEIAETLCLSSRTVQNYKEEIYRCLKVRNEPDLFRVALQLKIVTEDELSFYPPSFRVKPLPKKQLHKIVK
jgi:DNA-binding NarL/FixJ family response regulator